MARLVLIAGILVAALAASVPFVAYYLDYQDADLTLHFYDLFGVEPASVLRGKVVWITGASSGIGEQLAYEFTKHGSKVVLSARRVKELERVRDNCIDIAAKHHKTVDRSRVVLVVPLDLKQFDSHKNLTDLVLKHFGQIDILVNNAGVAGSGLSKDIALEDEVHILNTNLIGTMSLTKSVVPHMIARRQGHIAVVNSMNGKYAFPYLAAYSSSRMALKGYFDALRLELLNKNIDVSSHMIGPVNTRIFPDPKTGEKKYFSESFPQAVDMVPVSIFLEPLRCAQLMITAIVNSIDEPWISRHPGLAIMYISQYSPAVYTWHSKTVFIEWFYKLCTTLGMPLP